MSSNDTADIETQFLIGFTAIVVILGGMFSVAMGMAIYDRRHTYTTEYTEEHVIRIDEMKNPNYYYTIRYFDTTTGVAVKDGGRRCWAIRDSQYKIGSFYRVTVKYRTSQYKNEPAVTMRISSACDLIEQSPRFVR